MAVIAYLGSIFMYLLLVKVSQLAPGGDFFGNVLQGTFLFVEVVIVMVFLIIPQFQKETDKQTKQFAFLMVVFLLGYFFLKQTGLADPNIPFNWFLANVVAPLQHTLGH